MGANKRVAVRLEGAELRRVSLASKRAICEARLAYARSVGDARLVAANEAQLERIAAWERGES